MTAISTEPSGTALLTTQWRNLVGIATDYGLDGPGIEYRWGARFSAPVKTGPVAHPVSCTMGIGSFPRDKERRGREAEPLLPSSAVVKKV